MTQNNDLNNAVCDICQSGVDEEKDKILFCDGCNVAVHQSCYGRGVYPHEPKEDMWLCERCVSVYKRNVDPRDLRCRFCNDLKGLITRSEKVGWAHDICINWMPEIWYVWSEDLISGVSTKTGEVGGTVNTARHKVSCVICQE